MSIGYNIQKRKKEKSIRYSVYSPSFFFLFCIDCLLFTHAHVPAISCLSSCFKLAARSKFNLFKLLVFDFFFFFFALIDYCSLMLLFQQFQGHAFLPVLNWWHEASSFYSNYWCLSSFSLLITIKKYFFNHVK